MIAQRTTPTAITTPALVLLYGGAAEGPRCWPLDRDALIVGRSRGCDLALEATDVSGLHCVITCGVGGYAIRDCGSRAGTRVNGEPVQEATLHDGDYVKVGPFTFRVTLPPSRKAVPAAAGEPRHLRLERKRQNLARLALGLRRRLNVLLTGGQAEFRSARARADLLVRTAELQQRVREFEQRLTRLEQAERDLSRDRALLAQEQEAFFEEQMAAEREAAGRHGGLS
jgi:hypothetical protein